MRSEVGKSPDATLWVMCFFSIITHRRKVGKHTQVSTRFV